MKIELQIGGKNILHSDAPPHCPSGFIEVRICRDVGLPPAGDGVGEKIPDALFVQGQILEMHMRFERWLLRRANDVSREIGGTVHGEAAWLEPRKTGEIDIPRTGK